MNLDNTQTLCVVFKTMFREIDSHTVLCETF